MRSNSGKTSCSCSSVEVQPSSSGAGSSVRIILQFRRPRNVDKFFRGSGAESARVTLLENELGRLKQTVATADGCPKESVKLAGNVVF